MSIREAVDASRMHHQWMPDILMIERGDIPEKVINTLKRMGHNIEMIPFQGDAHSIFIDPGKGLFYGVSDKRRDGAAIGF
jgi:gamma-glutamyltranspeptidase/glutathione hydrolase